MQYYNSNLVKSYEDSDIPESQVTDGKFYSSQKEFVTLYKYAINLSKQSIKKQKQVQLQILLKLVKLNPFAVEIQKSLSNCFNHLENYNLQLHQINKVKLINPEDSDVHYQKSMIYIKNNQIKHAYDNINIQLRISEHETELLLYKSMILQHKQMQEDCILTCKEFLRFKFSEEALTIIKRMACCYKELKQDSKYLKQLFTIISFDVKNNWAWNSIAEQYQEMGLYYESILCYMKSFILSPSEDKIIKIYNCCVQQEATKQDINLVIQIINQLERIENKLFKMQKSEKVNSETVKKSTSSSDEDAEEEEEEEEVNNKPSQPQLRKLEQNKEDAVTHDQFKTNNMGRIEYYNYVITNRNKINNMDALEIKQLNWQNYKNSNIMFVLALSEYEILISKLNFIKFQKQYQNRKQKLKNKDLVYLHFNNARKYDDSSFIKQKLVDLDYQFECIDKMIKFKHQDEMEKLYPKDFNLKFPKSVTDEEIHQIKNGNKKIINSQLIKQNVNKMGYEEQGPEKFQEFVRNNSIFTISSKIDYNLVPEIESIGNESINLEKMPNVYKYDVEFQVINPKKLTRELIQSLKTKLIQNQFYNETNQNLAVQGKQIKENCILN